MESIKEEWDSVSRCQCCWALKENHLVDCKLKGYEPLLKWVKNERNLSFIANNANLPENSEIYYLVNTWFMNTCQVNHNKVKHAPVEFKITSTNQKCATCEKKFVDLCRPNNRKLRWFITVH